MSKPVKKKIKSKTKVAAPPAKTGLLNWFEDHYRVLMISVLVMAGLLRLILLLELPRMPFNQLHKAPELDMNFFDLWGDRIAGGDILTDTVWHPYHSWHKDVAFGFGVQSDEEAKQKWSEWYGGKKYHQEPLYPLIIGVAKMITSNGLTLVYILQMIIGILNIWMVMWLGKHYFGAMAGIAGGLLFTFYAPNLLFDATLLRTSFNTTSLISMVLIAEKLLIGKSKPWLMGLVGGIGYVLMTTSMLLWIPVVIRWLYLRRSDIRKSWQVVLGFGVVISFLVYRNSVADVPLMSTSSVGPITYILSNFPKYEPELGFVFFNQAGKVLEKTDGKMLPGILYMINLHETPFDWVLLQFRKLGALFHWYEIPNNINTYLAAEYSTALKIAVIPYSFIAALGLLGMVMNVKNRKTDNLQWAVLSQVIIMVAFYVLCRFRIPMVAMLAIFSGYIIQEIFGKVNWKRSLLLGAASIALWLFILRPYPKIPVLFERGDLSTYFRTYYHPELDKVMVSGDLNKGVDLFKELIGSMPSWVDEMDFQGRLKSWKDRDLVEYYGMLHEDLGNFYKDMGNTSQAEVYLTKGAKLRGAVKKE